MVSGSHGFIGGALVAALTAVGHTVARLVRPPRGGAAGAAPGPPAGAAAGVAGPWEVRWDIAAGTIDATALEGIDAVVHLAAAGIGEHRWTEEVKASIQDTRIDGTRLLCSALAGMSNPPSVLVSASAIGYYGDRGGEILDEASGPGTGFLAEVCQAWEAATSAAEAAGIRVVHLRTGIVQGPGGGAMARMLPLAKLGLGGRLGSGRQYMSWISLDDEVGAILHALSEASIAGPLNATSPNPVTNAAYTAVLARVLNRPAPLAVPAFALGAVLGKEMAADVVLASQRVVPTRLLDSGYRFRHPDLEGALRSVLGKSPAPA